MSKEIKKQLIDQPLHFFWAFMSTFPVAYAATVSTTLTPVIVLGLLGGVSITGIIIREIDQWPSSRWYDPYLDWLFFIVGACVGIYMGLTWTH